jgi:hypothetical protein
LLTYEFAGRVDKSHDFYPKWMDEWMIILYCMAKVNNPWRYRNGGTILKLKMESVKQNIKKNSSSRRWTDVSIAMAKTLEQYGFKVDSYEYPLIALDNFKSHFYDLFLILKCQIWSIVVSNITKKLIDES